MTTLKALETLHLLDVATFLRIVQWNTRKGIRRFARLISCSADGWLYPVVPALAALFSISLAIQLLMVLAIGFSIERASYYVLKNSFRRNRPPRAIPGYQSVITASDEFSFPSGHTSGAFLVATALAMLLPPVGIAGYFYGWATLVALSRVILGVHFPLDTLAGALLGSSLAWVALQLAGDLL
ncbi:phosphatase PAP2 family protein [Porticoccus sp.]|uniref:phosphatase PAP2 family protein n=1 Tax=Porticoccus sp. TaxID=2024853 RepID=UPI003F698B27